MAFGLSINNPSGQLVLSSDGITYGYIGKATLVAVGGSTITTNSHYAGNSTYTITWAGDLVVALPVKTAGTSKLLSLTKVGSVWTIEVHSGNGSLDADGFEVEAETEVFCFGSPVAVSGYGMALYDAAGVLAGDLSRMPIPVKALLSMAAGATSWSIPSGMTKPALIGWPFDEKDTSTGSAPNITNTYYLRGWRWDTGAGTVVRELYLHERELFTDATTFVHDTIGKIDAVLIEANGLT